MINNKFEAYKLIRELKRSGQKYKFFRRGLNKFKEKSTEPEEVCEILGLYHEQTSNVQTITRDGAVTRTEKIPMILCLMSDDVRGLQIDDEVYINDKTYKVSGVVNIMNWDIISDISLEVVDDGRNPV